MITYVIYNLSLLILWNKAQNEHSPSWIHAINQIKAANVYDYATNGN